MIRTSEYRSLIDTLVESFGRQNEYYGQLEKLVRKILGKVVLSRGDLTGVMPLIAEKQRLMEAISTERERTRSETERWQREKEHCDSCPETKRLDAILSETQEVIGRYLEGEEQLRTYLQHLMPKDGGGDGEQ
ncbi:MAG: hypothetical protein GF344_13815 [Chitinivibrionales bacterium]|nr:hypothetical protein [Chitinivibrionales bacterium]MBD3357806.1 hypothetical protein [Chitinivibrionales bacterium]